MNTPSVAHFSIENALQNLPIPIEQYNSLLELLYRSINSDNGFQGFVDTMVQCFDLSDIAIYSTNKSTLSIDSAWMSGHSTQALLEYIENKYFTNDYVLDFMQTNPPEKFYSLLRDIGRAEMTHPHQVQSSAEQWFDRHKFFDVCCAVVLDNEHHIVCIAAHRKAAQGHFCQDELELLDLLTPHIKQAYSAYHANRYSTETNTQYHYVEHSPLPTLLLGCNNEVLAYNAALCSYIDNEDLMEINHHKFQFKNQEQQQQFKMHGFVVTQNQTNRPLPMSCLTINKSDGSKLHCVFSPLSLQKGAQQCLVYFIDPSLKPQLNTDLIKSLYQLSDMEIRICEGIILGLTRVQIAQQLHRSHYTIKDHIQKIFSKFGVSKQSELIVIIITINSISSPLKGGN
jgi:DNA-binding CsgD family transcriptional regulator